MRQVGVLAAAGLVAIDDFEKTNMIQVSYVSYSIIFIVSIYFFVD